MNEPCPKCGNIPAIGTVWCQYFDADSEPYENGKKEPLKNGNNEIGDIFVSLSAQYCETCEAFVELSISESNMVSDE